MALVAIVEAENEKLIAVTGHSKVNLKSLLQQILAQDMACLSLCHTQCKQTKPEESEEKSVLKKRKQLSSWLLFGPPADDAATAPATLASTTHASQHGVHLLQLVEGVRRCVGVRLWECMAACPDSA